MNQDAERPRQYEGLHNAAQVSALQKQMAEKLTTIVKDVELRKWAVDQACGLAGAALEAEADKPVDVVKTAREIHSFLTEAAAEVK